MALKFIQTIRNEINSKLPDNTSGLITPALLREVVTDITDSTFNRGSSIFGDHQTTPVNQALTVTPTNYPSLYNNSINLSPEAFGVDQAQGAITLLQAGFVHTFGVSGNIAGPNNNTFIMEIYRNNVAEPRTMIRQATTGTGEFKAFDLSPLFRGIAANDKLDIRLSCTTPGTFEFAAFAIYAVLHPTISAV